MTINNFNRAIQFTLPWEVGKDKTGQLRKDGGINYRDGDLTIWGLFRKWHPTITEQTTLAEAIAIYKDQYWDYYKSRVPSLDLDTSNPDYAVSVFDSGVNIGQPKVYSWHLGAIKENDPTEYLLGRRLEWYNGLKSKKPKDYNGWINRLNDLKKYVAILRQEGL